MKSKEAIMILESIQPSCGEKYQFSESEIYEALDMAIEALESQDRQAIIAGSYLLEGKDTNVPSNNTVSRQQVLDALDRFSLGETDVAKLTFRLRDYLMRLPSAEPERSTEVEDILQCLDEELHPIVSPDNWWVYSKLHDMVSSLKHREVNRMNDKDTIYRQDAIDAECGVCQVVTKREKLNGCPYLFWGCAEVECLRKLPSAQPEPKWTLCSERQPENSGYYIVTTIIEEGCCWVGCIWYSTLYGWGYDKSPIAWMQLPEPYMGGEQDEND